MKKIFTLLFCVVAMGLAANASEFPMVDKCINVLLGNEQPTAMMAANLDANHDGEITIDDLAIIIDKELWTQKVDTKSIRIKPIQRKVVNKKDIKPKTEVKELTEAPEPKED